MKNLRCAFFLPFYLPFAVLFTVFFFALWLKTISPNPMRTKHIHCWWRWTTKWKVNCFIYWKWKTFFPIFGFSFGTLNIYIIHTYKEDIRKWKNANMQTNKTILNYYWILFSIVAKNKYTKEGKNYENELKSDSGKRTIKYR